MAGAKAIKAGEAYVQTYAKNDQLKKDLSKATNEVAKFGAQAGKLGGAQIAGAIGGPVGVAIGALGAAFKFGMDEFLLPVRQFAREVERSATLAEESLKKFESRVSKVREALAGMSDRAATPEGVTMLNDKIAEAQKELGGLETSLKSAQKQYESYDSALSSKENFSLYWSPPLTGGLAGEQAKLKPLLDEANQKYKAQLDLLNEMRRQKTEIEDPTKSMQAMQAITDFTRELREQLDVTKEINKETAEQAKLRKLAERFGFKPGTAGFDAATQAVKDLDAAKAAKALTDFATTVEESTDRLVNEEREHDKLLELNKMAEKLGVDDTPELERARKAVRDLNAAEAVEAAQEWGNAYDEQMKQHADLMTRVNQITKLGSGLPAAAWGSFSGISGNLQSPENTMRTSILGLLDGQGDTNKLLEDIVAELRNRLLL